MARTSDHRVRWAAFGAAVAVVLGAGIIPIARAVSGSASGSSIVPIAPCRLMDTRSGSNNVGPRDNPIGPGASYEVQVTGSNGQCSIPTTATGIVSNTTVTGGTAASFLTVYPAEANRPLASNLNWTAGQSATPNQVTVGLSPDGRIRIYNDRGSVNVIMDLVGYLVGAVEEEKGPTIIASGGITAAGAKDPSYASGGLWGVTKFGTGLYEIGFGGYTVPCASSTLPVMTVTLQSTQQRVATSGGYGPCVGGVRNVFVHVAVVNTSNTAQDGTFRFIVHG